jgi:hypothetical protein
LVNSGINYRFAVNPPRFYAPFLYAALFPVISGVLPSFFEKIRNIHYILYKEVIVERSKRNLIGILKGYRWNQFPRYGLMEFE